MNGDRAAADLVLATSLGQAKGGVAMAAAVAVSVSHARPSVLVAELGASGRRGATMLASGAARELEDTLRSAGLGAAARGRVCWTGLGSGEEALAELARAVELLPAGGLAVAHVPATLWQAALGGSVQRPIAALLRAELPGDRSLTAMTVIELRARGLPVRVASRPLGRVAARRAVAGLEAGTLRVGAFLTACASFVPVAVAAFAAEHPGVDVRLDQLEPPVSVPRLIDGEIDLAVVFVDEGDALDPRLESRKLADDPYRVALPPRHRLARRREIRLEELREERFSAPRAAGGGLRYRTMLERLCGFAPDFAYAVDDVTVARGLVAAGLTVAVMPDMTIAHPRADVAVKPIQGIAPSRAIHALWVRDRVTPGVRPMVAALAAAAP